MDAAIICLTPAAAGPERDRRALATGAARPIPTTLHPSTGGVRFVVRMLAGHNAKPQPGPAPVASAPHNPFLPYDSLFVAGLTCAGARLPAQQSPVGGELHLLVVDAYAPQDELLDADDFAAPAHCMAQVDGLAFLQWWASPVPASITRTSQVTPFLPTRRAPICP